MFRRSLALLGLGLACALPVHAATLSGSVSSEQGAPVALAQVSLSNLELGRTTTVYADAEGRYRLDGLLPGHYRFRARRLGFGTIEESGIELAEDSAFERSVTLKPLPKSLWIHELPASDWYAGARFSSPALSAQFAIQCLMCHQQGSSTTRIVRSEQDWHGIFDMMAEFGAVMTQQLYDEAPAVLNAAWDWNTRALDSFPDHPAVLDPAAAAVVIDEWDVGEQTSFLHDGVLGKDGRLYAVDWIGDKLYRLDPRTNETMAWQVPTGELREGGILGILAERGRRYTHHTPTVAPHSIQVAPDGKLWMTLSVGRGLASFDPVTEQFRTFDHPDRVKYPHTLRFDREGNIWYTASMTNHVVRFDTATESFEVFDLPTRNWSQWLMARAMGAIVWAANTFKVKGQSVVADPEINPVPYGIDVAPDGRVWFSQFNNSRLGVITPATGAIEMIDTPFPAPRRFRIDSRGVLWVPSYHEGKFFRFDPATRDFREYALPTGRGDMVYALAIDARDDSIWLCGTNSDTLIHFDPRAETFSTYLLPSRVSFTRELEVDAQGSVWTTTSNLPYYQMEGGQGKVIRLGFR